MADDGKKSDGGFPSSGVFWLVLLGAGALFLKELPWQGARPGGPEPKPYAYAAAQDIDARLWQDPIGAVARGREDARKRLATASGPKANVQPGNDHSATALGAKVRKRLCQGKDVLVLGVMVDGGPYPELVEARRRTRYAVLAGLNETGFVPDNEDHLGYFEPFDSNKPAGKYQSRMPDFIAYEWMNGDTSSRPSARPAMPKSDGFGAARLLDVLVLWLDEDVFGRHAQAKIQRVETLLGGMCEVTNDGVTPADLRFAVLGPGYTSTLQGMIKDANDGDRVATPTVAFYAYGATADDERLLEEGGIQGYGTPDPVHAYFRDRQIALFRTVTTDGRLAAIVKDELAKRSVKPHENLKVEGLAQRRPGNIDPLPTSLILKCPDTKQADWQHVVLIAEWDTAYGRSLPRIMAKQFASNDRCVDFGKDYDPPWVHRVQSPQRTRRPTAGISIRRRRRIVEEGRQWRRQQVGRRRPQWRCQAHRAPGRPGPVRLSAAPDRSACRAGPRPSGTTPRLDPRHRRAGFGRLRQAPDTAGAECTVSGRARLHDGSGRTHAPSAATRIHAQHDHCLRLRPPAGRTSAARHPAVPRQLSNVAVPVDDDRGEPRTQTRAEAGQ